MAEQTHEPTPEEIRQTCKEIQSEWSDREEASRAKAEQDAVQPLEPIRSPRDRR